MRFIPGHILTITETGDEYMKDNESALHKLLKVKANAKYTIIKKDVDADAAIVLVDEDSQVYSNVELDDLGLWCFFNLNDIDNGHIVVTKPAEGQASEHLALVLNNERNDLLARVKEIDETLATL